MDHAIMTYWGFNRKLFGRWMCTCGTLLPREPAGSPELDAAFQQHVKEVNDGDHRNH